ncbi:MAG: endonuclease/exonuclease/phosphatase family protein [Rhodothalassiaceae bacterium]
MKLMSWNIEYMNRRYEPDQEGPVKRRTRATGISDVDGLAKRVAQVIKDIDPDVLAIQEGPSRRDEMADFVANYLEDAYDSVGPAGKGQQKLFFLIKQSGAVAEYSRLTLAGDGDTIVDLGDAFPADIHGDQVPVDYDFTRPPLVVEVTDQNGETTYILNMHAKSKYIHNGHSLWNTDRKTFIRQALLARRRISAEAARVRTFVNALFGPDYMHCGSPGAGDGPRIAVLGDLNDGPGQDLFERVYLTHNVIAAIAGSPFQPRRMLRHAFIDRVNKEDNFTYRFDDFIDEIADRPVLLDHILLSAALYFRALQTAGVAHDAFNAQIRPDLPGKNEQLPSDHRPVFAEIG